MQRKDQFVGLPFYVFISLLLGALAVLGTLSVSQVSSLPIVLVYVLLFGVHIGLYWLNLQQHQNRRWVVFYYVLQAALIIALVSFPYEGGRVRLSILGASAICVIGEALGIWGNTKRALFLGLVYGALAFILVFLTVEHDSLWPAVSSLLVNGGFIVLLMVVLNQQFAEREKAEELAETLESANAKLAASAAKIEALTLQNERQRLARELHDTLAQGLSGLVLQLEAVKAHLTADHKERASDIVDQALLRARNTLAESRAAIDDLRAEPADLAASVHEKVDRFTQTTGIPCELDLALHESGVSTEVAVHVLSILSESLVNVTRHAEATHVNVKLIVHNNELELQVHDDGKGFDTDQETSDGHYGLLGMRERARLTGGGLTIESDAESGTNVRFVLNNLGRSQ